MSRQGSRTYQARLKGQRSICSNNQDNRWPGHCWRHIERHHGFWPQGGQASQVHTCRRSIKRLSEYVGQRHLSLVTIKVSRRRQPQEHLRLPSQPRANKWNPKVLTYDSRSDKLRWRDNLRNHGFYFCDWVAVWASKSKWRSSSTHEIKSRSQACRNRRVGSSRPPAWASSTQTDLRLHPSTLLPRSPAT